MAVTIPKEFVGASALLKSDGRFLRLVRQGRRFHPQRPLALLRLARRFGFEPSPATLVVIVLCGFQTWRVGGALAALARECRERRSYIYADRTLLSFGADAPRERWIDPSLLRRLTSYHGSPADGFKLPLPSSSPAPPPPAMPPSDGPKLPPGGWITRLPA